VGVGVGVVRAAKSKVVVASKRKVVVASMSQVAVASKTKVVVARRRRVGRSAVLRGDSPCLLATLVRRLARRAGVTRLPGLDYREDNRRKRRIEAVETLQDSSRVLKRFSCGLRPLQQGEGEAAPRSRPVQERRSSGARSKSVQANRKGGAKRARTGTGARKGRGAVQTNHGTAGEATEVEVEVATNEVEIVVEVAEVADERAEASLEVIATWTDLEDSGELVEGASEEGAGKNQVEGAGAVVKERADNKEEEGAANKVEEHAAHKEEMNAGHKEEKRAGNKTEYDAKKKEEDGAGKAKGDAGDLAKEGAGSGGEEVSGTRVPGPVEEGVAWVVEEGVAGVVALATEAPAGGENAQQSNMSSVSTGTSSEANGKDVEVTLDEALACVHGNTFHDYLCAACARARRSAGEAGGWGSSPQRRGLA